MSKQGAVLVLGAGNSLRQNIKIGKNVVIDGAHLHIEFEDPYDGSFKMPDDVIIAPGADLKICVRKGERVVYKAERNVP